MRTLSAGVLALRPAQWPKNVLVFAAPVASGMVFEQFWTVCLAALVFVAASSGVYLLNDLIDVEEDRLHPSKRQRPIAAGAFPPLLAWFLAPFLMVLSLVIALQINTQFTAVIALYCGTQIAYSVWLKEFAVIDLAIVVSGFVLRAIAGAVAIEVPLSQWFLLVAGFGSLFVVSGKRFSELVTQGTELGTRQSINDYTDSFLRFTWGMAATLTILSYSLWALEISPSEEISWHTLSIIPFVLAILRYSRDIDAGTAEEPEKVLLGDKPLLVLGAVWSLFFLLGIY